MKSPSFLYIIRTTNGTNKIKTHLKPRYIFFNSCDSSLLIGWHTFPSTTRPYKVKAYDELYMHL